MNRNPSKHRGVVERVRPPVAVWSGKALKRSDSESFPMRCRGRRVRIAFLALGWNGLRTGLKFRIDSMGFELDLGVIRILQKSESFKKH